MPDGASAAQHASAANRILSKLGGAKKPDTPKPKAPRFPHQMAPVWADFCEIIDGVAFNGMTQPSITWLDLRAWCDLTGVKLDPWHAKALVRLGAVRADILAERTKDGGHDKN